MRVRGLGRVRALAAASGAGTGRWAFRVPALRDLAFRVAAARGRALILLYHRVTPAGAKPADVVPVLSVERFRAQLAALAAVGDVVPLSALDEAPPRGARRRVRFAVTFDDDEPALVRHALPALRAAGLPATFFLMGRALHGLGAPWWVRLEAEIARRGLAAVAASLGVVARTPTELAAACRGTALAARVEAEFAPADGDAPLGGPGVRALVAAGMAVGFHTVHHAALTGLPDADVARALDDGRAALAAAAGAPADRVAYPHGRADARVAALARAAGYAAGYTTARRPVHAPPTPAGLARWGMGRWEAGPLAPETLLAEAAFRLALPPAEPAGVTDRGDAARPPASWPATAERGG